MNRIEASQSDRTEQLVDVMLTVIWSKGVQKEHNNLLKGNSAQRKRARNLVRQTAERLLENPQDISIAERAWRTNEGGQDEPQNPQEPFLELVREQCLALIKDKWKDVMPKQLAQLVKIYANKDESQKSGRESAENLLRNYFKGPENRNQRIDAYYNFVSGVLDLAEEGEAFKEGMKIALHATDILPKSPSLIDQSILVSLPSNEEGTVAFREALVVNYVISQLRFMGLQDLAKYYQDREDFVRTDKVKEQLRENQQRVVKAIGHDRVKELNDKMLFFFATITQQLLSEERKQALKEIWPFKVAFNQNDPLNQKFNAVFSNNVVRSVQGSS